jgi:hypothetical protein
MNRNMTDRDSLAEAIDVIKGCKSVGCEWCEKKIAVVIRDAKAEEREACCNEDLIWDALSNSGPLDEMKLSALRVVAKDIIEAIRNRNTGE